MNLGLTLPNLAFDPYTPADLVALGDLKPSILVMLLYGGAIDQTHIRQINAFNGRLILRPYAGNIPEWTPIDWAKECFRRINQLGVVGECIPANEFNLEGFGTDWQAQIDWLTAFAAAWRKLSSRKLHLPALSPQPGYEYGLMAYAQSGLYGLFDVVDLHAYAEAHLQTVETVARATTKPCIITEYNQVSSETVAASGLDSVYFLLGGTEDQAQYDILKDQAAYASFKKAQEAQKMPTDFSSPNHDGPRKTTLGVVLHATLSGKPISVQQEYESTCNYFQNPAPDGDPGKAVSAHAVVGPNGQLHRPVHTDVIAWHCRASNQTHLGIEMAKPHLGDVIGPDILDAAAKLVAGWCHDYEIPLVWSTTRGIEEHRNMPTNTDGHQDVGGPFDRADFLARVKHYAGEDELTEQQKTEVLAHLDVLWGYTKAETIIKDPAESEMACHERIVAIKETLGLNG